MCFGLLILPEASGAAGAISRRGRTPCRLANERKPKNIYSVTWDGTDNKGAPVASGIYFYKLVAGSFTQTKKMLLLK
jgi:hypothetical protein